MKPKKYYQQTINFGKEGTISRVWAETFSKERGKRSLSSEIRRLIGSAYGGNPDDAYFQRELKKRALLNERLSHVRKMQELNTFILNIDEELIKLGYDPEQEAMNK